MSYTRNTVYENRASPMQQKIEKELAFLGKMSQLLYLSLLVLCVLVVDIRSELRSETPETELSPVNVLGDRVPLSSEILGIDDVEFDLEVTMDYMLAV